MWGETDGDLFPKKGMDIGNIKAAGIAIVAGAVGDVREVVGKSGSTEKEEYGQKDGHKEA